MFIFLCNSKINCFAVLFIPVDATRGRKGLVGYAGRPVRWRVCTFLGMAMGIHFCFFLKCGVAVFRHQTYSSVYICNPSIKHIYTGIKYNTLYNIIYIYICMWY